MKLIVDKILIIRYTNNVIVNLSKLSHEESKNLCFLFPLFFITKFVIKFRRNYEY